MTQSFEFILDIEIDDDEYLYSLVEQLFKVGCDDATFGIRNGEAYLIFDREASSMEEAIASATKEVESLGIKIKSKVVL
jgi:hypothetical protein